MAAPNHLVGERIGNSRIHLISLLGEGSYGAVYRALLYHGRIRKANCAVKVLRTNVSESSLLCQRREAELHKRVSNGDGIVTLYESFKEGNYHYLVMKFCSGRDLWYGINKKRYIGNDALIKDIFIQILDAIEYCHSYNVYHRDIKPENILLSRGGHKALLSDFGLATGECISTETHTGSPGYMSPECWDVDSSGNGRPYATGPSDVWSLGVLLVNLACRRQVPWIYANNTDRFFRDFIKQPDLFRLFIPLSPEVHDILSRVFTINPVQRITIKDLKAAIQNVKHFGIPTSRLAEYYNYQRAVLKATVRVPAPPKPFALGRPHILVIPRPSRRAGNTDDSPHLLVVKNVPTSKVGDVPGPCARAQQRPPPSSSSVSSEDSDGPCTPETHAFIPGDEVPEIGICDGTAGDQYRLTQGAANVKSVKYDTQGRLQARLMRY